MTTTLQSIISPVLVAQGLVLALFAVSFGAFINAEVAFVSAFLILIGSMFSYRKLIRKNLENDVSYGLEDVAEKIDDPYDLYGEDEVAEEDARPLKDVIKEEKARLKANRQTVKNISKSAPALFSLTRLVPYGVLVLGFIALKNNQLLDLWYFLPGLAVGIVAGYFSGVRLFAIR